MTPVDADDLWFVYNLIAHGDSVMAVTVRYSFKKNCLLSNFLLKVFKSVTRLNIIVINRKVLRETSTGRDAERVKLKLEIKVEVLLLLLLLLLYKILVFLLFFSYFLPTVCCLLLSA